MVGPIGFGTGCLYKNIQSVSRHAVQLVCDSGATALEIACLRRERVPLLRDLRCVDLEGFVYVSLHAPCDVDYATSEGKNVLSMLEKEGYRLGVHNVTFHPDIVSDPLILRDFALPYSIENMDSRKKTGQFVRDLVPFVSGGAQIVLDVNHAYHNDGSGALISSLYSHFSSNLTHIDLAGHELQNCGFQYYRV